MKRLILTSIITSSILLGANTPNVDAIQNSISVPKAIEEKNQENKNDLIQDVRIYLWQIITKYDSTQSKFTTYMYNHINWFLGSQHFKNVSNFNINYNEFNEDLYANNNDSIESEANEQDLNTILKLIWNDLSKNEQKEIIAQSLGNVDDLVVGLKELDTPKSHTLKLAILISLLAGSFWLSFFGLDMIKDKYLQIEPLDPQKQEINFEDNFKARQEKTLNDVQSEYDTLTNCITNKEDLK